ncbi:hypothetical protein PDE_01439 [Penicillium oxalicum 114-2]|uniref:Uncharacterized protein n=1 Tax=Penicillium oxalicum (strain 114-2 / CGMCC 5302) TaxID=933388 RepID=S8AX56_PENO1|nr:hypothetical protein PDE_01439 [Penicillium oxalicum 114-2]
MDRTADSERMLGLTLSDQRILLYGILFPCTDGSRNPVDYVKLAAALEYTPSSAKVMYGNARRKLARNTGIDLPHNPRGTAPRTKAAGTKTTGSLGNSEAPAKVKEAGESGEKLRKGRPPVASRKRKADELETPEAETVTETKAESQTQTQAKVQVEATVESEAVAEMATGNAETKAELDEAKL